jgi:NAD(P)-dependent dehydrogenase (short-subunit alcohol dehydrogenase family)
MSSECGGTSPIGPIWTRCSQVRSEKGRLDILFANAGLGEFAALGEITEAHFDRTFGVNVRGSLFTVQKALPLMRAGGSIILTGSTTGSTGTPAFSVYAASKAAIRSFARNWILDLKGTGIRVNILSPGPTATPGVHGLVPEPEREQFTELLASQIPLGRVAQPEEIAAAALFLASDESSFVNGIELFADGGAGLKGPGRWRAAVKPVKAGRPPSYPRGRQGFHRARFIGGALQSLTGPHAFSFGGS